MDEPHEQDRCDEPNDDRRDDPNEPRPNDRRPDRPKRPPRIKKEPVGAWLVIRYDLGDAGARPIPNGDVFWLSPDIWITGGDALGNAIVGRPTSVHARIWNFGTFPAASVQVDFRYAAPSIGIPWTAPALIGTAWINVLPLSTAVADCPTPWIPAPGSAHSCLIVTCACTPMDPPVAPGDVRNDRKTGQRNVDIVVAEAGKTLSLELMIGRTRRERGTVEVAALAAIGVAEPAVAALAARPLERILRTLGRDPAVARLSGRRALALRKAAPQQAGRLLEGKAVRELVTSKVDAEPAGPTPAAATQAAQLQAPAGRAPADAELEGHMVPLGSFTVEPLQQRPLRLELRPPVGAEPVAVHLFQFENGEATGGYTVIVRPPSKDLPFTPNDPRSKPMENNETDVQRLVIEAFPAAAAAHEIARQLVGSTPIKSRDHLLEIISRQGLKVGGGTVDPARLGSVLPAEVFPIQDAADLVRKVAAAIRVGADLVARGDVSIEDKALAKLAVSLAREPMGGRYVAAGAFKGPSVFGGEAAEAAMDRKGVR